MFRLDGRVGLVTGAGLGAGAGRAGGARIGFGIASAMAAQGAAVVINDLDPVRVEAAVAEIRAAGGKAAGVAFDVTDEAAVAAGFAQAAQALGPVNILVNNAGLHGASPMSMRPFLDYAPGEWRAPVDANLYGALNCARAALPAMIAGGWGRVIYISSDAGRMGPSRGLTVSLYAAAKAGAAHFMRHLSREVGQQGITCNVISTGLMGGSAPTEFEEAQIRAIPSTRLGRRDDIAAAAVFFASDEAEWINGQTLPVNGGSATS
ncbi:SDR family NAD(P)-dependent oxidoreductase [Phenylobacterium sp.]|uniref:SDR family NAD(P)-dependent oxidoreductase n=1 Tax=Phenylobacterium sp. TaxID=1871053 RepID=UPI002F4132FB